MKSLGFFRSKSPAFPDLLNYAAVPENGVVLLKSGALMASWQYTGVDSSSMTHDELDARSAQVNNALIRLGSGWMTQHDVFRVQSLSYPPESDCHFPDRVTRAIDQERREVYQSGSHHENIHVVTLTYLPPSVAKAKTSSMMVEGEESFDLAGVGEQSISYFLNSCREFESTMAVVCDMRRLRGQEVLNDIYGSVVVHDEQLQFIHHCITGDNHPIALPPIPMFLDRIIGGREFWPGLNPVIGKKYIGVVTIDGFPQTSFPGILEGLDQLNFEYRWNSRFIYEDPYEAIKQLNKFRRKWQQKKRGFIAQLTKNYNAPVDKFAERMEQATQDSIADASSGEVLFGYYTSTIVVFDTDLEKVRKGCETIQSILNNQGFNGRIESINSNEAYLGSLPGHSSENIRRPVIHTLNLADLLPMSSVWPGHSYCPNPYYPPKSPPLLFTSTTGSTPFRVNLHMGDLGHTLILGPTGAGKSTLLALMAGQFRKYREATVFVFEKGYSFYPIVSAIQAVGGDASHFDIGGNDSISFCPLRDIDSDADQAWAEDWLTTMYKLSGVEITPDKRAASRSALSLHRRSEDKTLSDFRHNLQHQELKQALERYTIGEYQDSAILDAEEDNFKTSSFNVFELEHLMDMGDDMILPVFTYLFHRIEKKLKGQPTVIFIDEAWIALGNKHFAPKIREWLKTYRKKNCIIVLSTQSISDALGSGIIDVINESCPTKIYLPNVVARDESAEKLYRSLGLNDREIDLIARAIPKREYYFRNPEGRRLFNLLLGPVALAFVGATGRADIARIKELQQQLDNRWLEQWCFEQSIEFDQFKEEAFA